MAILENFTSTIPQVTGNQAQHDMIIANVLEIMVERMEELIPNVSERKFVEVHGMSLSRLKKEITFTFKGIDVMFGIIVPIFPEIYGMPEFSLWSFEVPFIDFIIDTYGQC